MRWGRTLIIIGLFVLALGLVVSIGEKLPIRLGRLPGDIIIRGKNSVFYFPIVTSLLISLIFEKIVEISRQQGITILLVEQNAHLALEISHYAYVLETGRVALEGPSRELRDHPLLKAAYLGG